MSKPIVYLAGPINGLSYWAAVGWRVTMREQLGPFIEVLSPMRGKLELRNEEELHGNYPDSLHSRPDTIVQRDLSDVRRADLIIVNGLQGSYGTALEVGYAVRGATPVVLVLPEDDPLRGHPFVLALPGLSVVATLDEAAQVARSMFNV